MKKLALYNEDNEREVEAMVGKAMCAYANLSKIEKHEELAVESGALSKEQVEVAKAKHASEYEATVRCIELFAKDDIYAIQHYIIDRVYEEFGIA